MNEQWKREQAIAINQITALKAENKCLKICLIEVGIKSAAEMLKPTTKEIGESFMTTFSQIERFVKRQVLERLHAQCGKLVRAPERKVASQLPNTLDTFDVLKAVDLEDFLFNFPKEKGAFGKKIGIF